MEDKHARHLKSLPFVAQGHEISYQSIDPCSIRTYRTGRPQLVLQTSATSAKAVVVDLVKLLARRHICLDLLLAEHHRVVRHDFWI